MTCGLGGVKGERVGGEGEGRGRGRVDGAGHPGNVCDDGIPMR